MPHPLVVQLRFTRSEWLRALSGISDAEARRRFPPMNCISWMVGHLAWQEQQYWLVRAQGRTLVPILDGVVGKGRPASTPPLEEMWAAWRTVTTAADAYLDRLTTEGLQSHRMADGQALPSSVGTMLQRMIYHYWYHLGEAMAVRQMLGHANLPEFVGDMSVVAPYRPDRAG